MRSKLSSVESIIISNTHVRDTVLFFCLAHVLTLFIRAVYKLQLELSGKTSRARPRASSKRPSKTNCSGVIPQQSPSLPHPQPRSACSSTTATPDKAYVEDFNWSSIYRTASAPCWSSQAPVYQPDYSAPATFRENLEWCSPPSWDTSLLPWPSFSSETYYHSWE